MQSHQEERYFDPAMIETLPEPARRYFLFSIFSGAPLRTAVEIEMSGELGLGDKQSPKYQEIEARQLLAPPYGLVWRVRSRAFSGSDGATPRMSWTRFWLFGIIPFVRAGGNGDHQRSAFGRVVAEAAFWSPASLLPSESVRWENVEHDTSRAIVSFGAFEQAVDITVLESGQPVRVIIARWSNENARRKYRLQPFGGYLSEFREFDGYRLATRVEGGNLIGTPDYFPFYRARVKQIRMLAPAAAL